MPLWARHRFVSSQPAARMLLSRIEDETTGELLLPELEADVPAARRAQAAATGGEVGRISDHLRLVDGARPTTGDPAEQLLATTWRPTLSVTGAEGLPPLARAGNVLRPSTKLMLSFRLAPTTDPEVALGAIHQALTTDPPYGAAVRFDGWAGGRGWDSPELEPWLERALDEASIAAFGSPARLLGEGGSIPFMAMLGERFPDAQFVITGVLGPDANAHGPNEYLHLPTARKITLAIAELLNGHARRGR